MMPVKDSQTRIKPWTWTLASHDRHARTGNSCVRWGIAVACNRYKFITVSILKRSRSAHIAAVSLLNRHLDPEGLKCPLELLESTRCNSFPRRRRGRWAWL